MKFPKTLTGMKPILFFSLTVLAVVVGMLVYTKGQQKYAKMEADKKAKELENQNNGGDSTVTVTDPGTGATATLRK